MSSLFVLLQSEYALTAIFVSTITFIGLLTYLFGFNKPTSTSSSSNQTKTESFKQKTKQKEDKRKKQKEKTVESVEVLQKPEVTAILTKTVATEKVQLKQEAVKVATANKQVKEVEPIAKKQTKKEKVKQVAQEVEPVQAQITAEDVDVSGWTTVIDKRAQKKQSLTQPAQIVQAEEKLAKKSDKKKQNTSTNVVTESVNAKSVDVSSLVDRVISATVKQEPDTLVIGSKQSSELLTTSLIAKTETKVDDEWITATTKSKKNSKSKKETKENKPIETVVVAEQPAVSRKQESLPSNVTAIIAQAMSNTSSASSSPKVETKNKKKSKQVNQSDLVAKIVQDAIVDTVAVDSNNNLNKKPNPQKQQKPQLNLKQTSLTESIILIEKDLPSTNSKRTESNQSSSDSLQDVDGDEGFITITSKKSKKNVRREQ